MKVMSINDTVIKVGLSGGITGNYIVVAQFDGRGFAKNEHENSTKFEYANRIFQISPSNGSYFGGR